MEIATESRKSGISRRDSFRASGLALGGLAMAGLTGRSAATAAPRGADVCGHAPCYPTNTPTEGYSYFRNLPELNPADPATGKRKMPPLRQDEMRISFLGSVIPQYGRAQAMMSVFVEVGWVRDNYWKEDQYGPSPNPPYKALDQFVFECGSGVLANYNAMNIGFARMDKIFINHLHPDHMNDLTSIYGFGPSSDRKCPLFVWGPGPSGVKNPGTPPYSGSPAYYADGTKAFCEHFREMNRWQTEAFSFQTTRYKSYKAPTRQSWGLPCDPVPVGDDPPDDGYAIVPIELDWTRNGVAYNNRETGVKITHFKVIHCRKGSIGYKLEWNGMSMIYTSDTRPETLSIMQASGGKGVDVFIHEMVPPADVWAMKLTGRSEPGSPNDPMWVETVRHIQQVQDSSHTPQGAFGYLLSQIRPRPRLTVATHFPANDDTIACALASVQKHCPWVRADKENGNFVWSCDFMVLRVFPDHIKQRRAVVSDYTYAPYPSYVRYDPLPPKYHTQTGDWDPTAQIDLSTEIPPGPDTWCEDGY